MTDPLDKITTILATALLAENDNETRNALAGARAKIARAGIDIHRLRLSDDRNRSADRGHTLAYDAYVAKLERAETTAEYFERLAASKQEVAERWRTRAYEAERKADRLTARIAKLTTAAPKTRARIVNTTEWVTHTRPLRPWTPATVSTKPSWPIASPRPAQRSSRPISPEGPSDVHPDPRRKA